MALSSYREGYDFAGALIGETNTMAAAGTTRTLDKRAARLNGFDLVG